MGRKKSQGKDFKLIPCACGCGSLLCDYDAQGRSRRYIRGHNRHARKTVTQCLCDWCDKIAIHNGYCNKHYEQVRRHGMPYRSFLEPNEIVFKETYAEIILRDFSGDETGRALIDLDDVDRVMKYKWHLSDQGYVAGGKSPFRLSRVILTAPVGYEVDHVNHNKLDNRKTNLRICTHSQNCMNMPPIHDIKGIYWERDSKRWVAQIGINNKDIKLGRFKDKEEAIRARKQAETELFGEFAYRATERNSTR